MRTSAGRRTTAWPEVPHLFQDMKDLGTGKGFCLKTKKLQKVPKAWDLEIIAGDCKIVSLKIDFKLGKWNYCKFFVP